MRHLGIDLARSVAILLVVVGHSMAAVNLRDATPNLWGLRPILELTAPAFFFCSLGTMLQLVYLPRFAAGKRRDVLLRLWARALECWFLYALSCAVMCLVWHTSFLFWLRCALFLFDTAYTDILRFFAVMLALGPLMVWTSHRFGLWPLALLAGAIHAAYPVLSSLGPVGHFPGAAEFSSFLYGGRMIEYSAPSVLHGFGFVVAGMAIGRILQAQPGRAFILARPVIRWAYAGVALAFAAVLAIGRIDILEPDTLVYLRYANHPLYVVAGTLAVVLFIDLCTWLCRAARIGARSIWLSFGRNSLFIFAYGSCLLYLLRPDRSTPGSVTTMAVAIAAQILMSLAYTWLNGSSLVRSDHWLARAYRWFVKDSAAAAIRFVLSPVARRIAPRRSTSGR